MRTIDSEIEAFDSLRDRLEREHRDKWVLIHDAHLVDVYTSFEAAAQDALARFGRGPFLIRQVGAQPITLPISAMYHPPHGQR